MSGIFASGDHHFATRHLTEDLKGRSLRGGAVTFASQFLKLGLLTAATAMLARMLSPEDYGLLAMVWAVNGFIDVFRELGLSTATIQKAEINHEQVSMLFWLNVMIGALIMGATALLAPMISAFYGNPAGLTEVVRWLSIGFLIGGLNAQHRALLNRQMRFTALAGIDVVATFISVAVAIWFAADGAGCWALVYGQLTLGIVMIVGVWSMSGWRPGRPVRTAGIRAMICFGGNTTGSNLVNYFSRNMDTVVIGRFRHAAELGLYDKAYGLLLLPIQQITMPLTRVAIPALSRLQNDPMRYRGYYRKALLLVCTIGMPLVAFLFVAADSIIPLLLGPKWTGAVRIFRVLAPAAFFGTFNVATIWVYTSLGRTDRQFRWGIVTSALTVVAFLVGVHWGAIGVGVAFSIVYCGVTMGPPGVVYCFRNSPLRPMHLVQAVWRPAVASIGAAAMLWLFEGMLPAPGALWRQVLNQVSVFGVLYIAFWAVLPGGLKLLGEMLEMSKELLPRAATAHVPRPFETLTIAPMTIAEKPAATAAAP